MHIGTTTSISIHLSVDRRTWTPKVVHQWTSRLFSYPGYCKSCCYKYWGTCVFLKCLYLVVCPVVGFLGHMVNLFLFFKGISILLSIVAAQFTFPPKMQEDSFFLHILSSIYCLLIFCWWPFWQVWGGILRKKNRAGGINLPDFIL